MHRGYVKVWRKINDSGLMQMPNTLALFMYILFNATHKDIKTGTTIGVVELKRGQYIDGLHRLSKKLKQTPRQVRTSQKRLIDLNIISVKATNKYTVYTIENYSKYQDSDTQNDKQTTNKRQTNDKQTTTKQEHKHIRTEEILFSEVSKEVMKEWLAVRKKKRGSALSEIVQKAITRESVKAGLTLEQAIIVCVERNWITFNSEWYVKAPNKRFTNQRDEGRNIAAKSIFKTESKSVKEYEVQDAKTITS